MKFVKLSGMTTSNVETVIFEKNGLSYHNIKHGTFGKELWKWSAGLRSDLFPVVDNKPIVLDKDNYILNPIIKSGVFLKDKIGNTLFSVSCDDMLNHKSDVVLLWEPGMKNVVSLDITIEGHAESIGTGYTGKVREGSDSKIPTPVIEITGDCKLTWSGVTSAGNTYKQVIEYDYEKESWSIQIPVKV